MNDKSVETGKNVTQNVHRWSFKNSPKYNILMDKISGLSFSKKKDPIVAASLESLLS